MDRINFLLGNNRSDVTHNGGDTTKDLQAEVILGGEKLADISAVYHPTLNFVFYDIQDLFPEFNYPLPEFPGWVQSNVDALRKLDFVYTQTSGYKVTQTDYVLLNAGRSSYIERGKPYSLRKPVPFLTNQPNFKKITPFSQEWLFLPLNFGASKPSQLNLKATAVGPTGELTVVVLHTVTALANFTVLGIDASPYKVMPALPADTVGYYFQVYDQLDEVVSEARYYHAIPDHEEDFTLVFRNSLGTWDTLTLQGNQQRKISIERSTVAVREKTTIANTMTRRSVQLRASGLDVRWQVYMQELVMSREVYLIENGYHSLIPEDEQLDYLDSANYTENMEFGFKFSNEEGSY